MNICKTLFASKLALVLVLGYVAVRVLMPSGNIDNSLAPASAHGKGKTQATETTHLTDLSLEDYTQIAKRNPFGTPGQTTKSGKQTSAINSSNYQRSVSQELGLKLFGTVSGSPEVARAIIKDLKTDAVDLYKTGQVVGDARIESINTDMVVLLHNEDRKILRFNTGSSGSNNDNNTRAPLTKAADETRSNAITDLLTPEPEPAIQTKIGCVEAILKKAVIKPYTIDGQTEGLRITGLENLKTGKRFGLKNGDVIRTVNGHSLTSKQKAYQVFKKARSQSDITFELSRNGKTKKLSFGLR